LLVSLLVMRARDPRIHGARKQKRALPNRCLPIDFMDCRVAPLRDGPTMTEARADPAAAAVRPRPW
jgi:hypothetical protein